MPGASGKLRVRFRHLTFFRADIFLRNEIRRMFAADNTQTLTFLTVRDARSYSSDTVLLILNQTPTPIII